MPAGQGGQIRLIRYSIHVEEQIQRLRATKRKLQEGYDTDVREIAFMADLSENDVRELERLEKMRVHSLYVQYPTESGPEDLAELLTLDGPDAIDQLIEGSDLREMVRSALDRQSHREARILARRFGLAGGKEGTLQEIGDAEGVTRERIRQLEKIALDELRSDTKLRDAVVPYVLPEPALRE